MDYYSPYAAGNNMTNALGLRYSGNPIAGMALQAQQSMYVQQPVYVPQQQVYIQPSWQQQAQQQAQQQQFAMQQQQQQFANSQANQTHAALQQLVAQQQFPQQSSSGYQTQPRFPGQQPRAVSYVPVTTTTVRYY